MIVSQYMAFWWTSLCGRRRAITSRSHYPAPYEEAMELGTQHVAPLEHHRRGVGTDIANSRWRSVVNSRPAVVSKLGINRGVINNLVGGKLGVKGV